MKVLVTGATGFIGGEVVIYLARNDDFEIIATGRSETNRFQPLRNVEFIRADLTKKIPSGQYDICIHCAGLADDQTDESTFHLHNVMATQLLTRSLNGCNVFIFISSSSVYDFRDGMIKSETDASENSRLSVYGRSKLAAERIVIDSGINSIYILRPRAVYGTNDRILLPRILKLLKGRIFVVPGNLNVKASLTHIDNLTEVVEKTVTMAEPGVHIYNITDRESYVLRDVFRHIGQLKRNKKVRFITIPVWVIRMLIHTLTVFRIKSMLNRQSVDYLIYDSLIDNSKSVKELGIDSKYDFYNDYIRSSADKK